MWLKISLFSIPLGFRNLFIFGQRMDAWCWFSLFTPPHLSNEIFLLQYRKLLFVICRFISSIVDLISRCVATDRHRRWNWRNKVFYIFANPKLKPVNFNFPYYGKSSGIQWLRSIDPVGLLIETFIHLTETVNYSFLSQPPTQRLTFHFVKNYI